MANSVHCANLKTWKDIRLTLIHEHHANEEEIFIPWLATKIAIPAKVQADHKVLMKLLDEISTLIDAIAATQDVALRKAAFTDLSAKWPHFRDTFLAHIREEEVQLVPLMMANFDYDEYTQMTSVSSVLYSIPSGAVCWGLCFPYLPLPWLVQYVLCTHYSLLRLLPCSASSRKRWHTRT